MSIAHLHANLAVARAVRSLEAARAVAGRACLGTHRAHRLGAPATHSLANETSKAWTCVEDGRTPTRAGNRKAHREHRQHGGVGLKVKVKGDELVCVENLYDREAVSEHALELACDG
jgi:hypothetical protein